MGTATTTKTADTGYLDDVLRVLAYAAHQRNPIEYATNVFLDLRLAMVEDDD